MYTSIRRVFSCSYFLKRPRDKHLINRTTL
uniref:Uncharacterized protein n=1 Tax=Siphoviridae sp. ctRRO23 TaxID=2826334 RepID=A0A8S5LT32_9CAUD|nr:MAG TPA: hypothetical protein [Siphoviridae sp. ctRRO23]